MKRSPMKRGKPLHRQSRINPVNRKRRAAKKAERYGPQAALCRTLPCCACGVCDESEPHHHPTVARGGTDRDTVPLCADHHTLGGRPEAFHSTPLAEWETHHSIEIEAEKVEVRRLLAREPDPPAFDGGPPY